MVLNFQYMDGFDGKMLIKYQSMGVSFQNNHVIWRSLGSSAPALVTKEAQKG